MRYLVAIFFLLLGVSCFANPTSQTYRIPQIANKKVTVWETIIYPNQKQKLPRHRHNNDRVVVALTNGVLKVTTDKGETHWLKLVKNHSYFLSADPQSVLHTDENIGKKPVKVIVVGLN